MKEIKPTIIEQAGGIIFVKYPHFRNPHLYIAIKGYPIHCCQCDIDIPQDGQKFIEHVMNHSKRKHHKFLIAAAPDLISGTKQYGEWLKTKQEAKDGRTG